ncbi:hypothetical protein NNJEOMEG_01642 [Fundidesulfovibrio magnetotacticus]|uniref:Uncharacterized protein n=1 Tax=Fundidesulfovibrio magnetotacticus TaxID=2730080 RepID=A0A6V8LVW3_9BACT|nr:hypothetical protein [Fundidesulfovibrio magnetotacticus]GFK93807.1 hypothetical protein NNJEOMEG_01642 [Fundidesulfovibrio magnetotacticus]
MDTQTAQSGLVLARHSWHCRGARTSSSATLSQLQTKGPEVQENRQGDPGRNEHRRWNRARDEMWGTGMATTMTLSEGNASIYFAIDHCSLCQLPI